MSEQSNNSAMGAVSPEQTANIELIPNGPMVVSGKVCIKDADGNTTEKTDRTYLCRCGASANKPYCDGTHKKVEFKG